MSLNFNSIRYLIVFVILLPIIIKYIKVFKTSKSKEKLIDSDMKTKIPIIILSVCIIVFIAIKLINYPYENLFVNFKNSNDIFNYYNPSYKVNKKIEDKNYAFFISRKSGTEIMSCHYYIKTKGWHIDTNNKYGRVVKYDNTLSLDPTAPQFIITELYKEKKVYIYARFLSKNDGKDIQDSEESEIIDINRTGIDWYGKLIILDSNKIDYSNYYITIGDRKYKILNKNNKTIKKKSYN